MPCNFIYITTNLLNNKQYVGSHYGEIDDKYLGSGRALLKSIKFYGKENFSRTIITECDASLNLMLEERYIAEFNTLVPNGYNISPTGGHGINGKMSVETKKKISAANKGIPKPIGYSEKASLARKGKPGHKWSESKKLEMSESRKGELNPMFGKKLSNETKSLMSGSHKTLIRSEEHKESIRRSKIGNSNPMFGSKWMNNGVSNKSIHRSKIEKYINDGWSFGRIKGKQIQGVKDRNN